MCVCLFVKSDIRGQCVWRLSTHSTVSYENPMLGNGLGGQ